MKIWFRAIFVVALFCVVSVGAVGAQTLRKIPVECGMTVQDEITVERRERWFSIDLVPGDTITVALTPLGNTFDVDEAIYDPTGPLGDGRNWIADVPGGGPGPGQTDILSVKVSSTGTYLIKIVGFGESIGAYTIAINCLLNNGTLIEPTGDILSIVDDEIIGSTSNSISSDQPLQSITLPADFVGFPGLPPVDFANGIAIPFIVGQANNGSIAPAFDSVFGFTLDANAGDKLDLTFTRLSGNLNLGLAVLSADNKIVYQASLVNTERMNALFTLPAAGTYTIGVYKIDLIPVDAPENTAFQLTGVLNP